jgi:hypothetical protein
MALSDDDYKLLQNLLEGLEPETKKLATVPQRFVRDQLERFEKFGQETWMSAKQWEWLKDLYIKNVGPLPDDYDPRDDEEPELPLK